MKFYNPFKPHIISFVNNVHYVRKFGILGWEYLDCKDAYWWTQKNKWNCYDTLKSALNRINSNKLISITQ